MNATTIAVLDWIEANESGRWDERADELLTEGNERSSESEMNDELFWSFVKLAETGTFLDPDSVQDVDFVHVAKRIVFSAVERYDANRHRFW